MPNITNAAGTAANYIPKFNSATIVSNSIILQSASGNIGIGTTTPGEKLDVSGTLQMTGFKFPVSPVAGYILTSDANGYGSWQPAPGVTGGGSVNALSKFTGTNTIADSVINEFSGNIGIGTATPSQKLSVNGTIESTSGGVKFPDGSLQTTAASSSGIPSISESSGKVGIGLDPTRNPQEKLTIAPDSNFVIEMPTPEGVIASASQESGALPADDYYFRVSASEGVGWTKASAQLRFDLTDDNAIRVSWNPVPGATKYRVYRALTATGAYKYIETVDTFYDYTGDGVFTLSGSPPEETTAYTNKLSAANDNWFLGGKVGIGTATPMGELHVKENNKAANLFLESDIQGESAVIRKLMEADGAILNILATDQGANGQPRAISFNRHSSAGGEVMLLDPRGDVHIYGNLYERSSRRFKKNIQPIRNALDTIRKLYGVCFEWRESGKPDIGLVAEETGAVIPEIVAFEENGRDAQGLDYSGLVAVLIEAVKEQQTQIDDLKSTVKLLLADRGMAAGSA